MTLLATVVVLGVLILVHELGHFWAAKSFGIKVLRFSIGLGPRMVGFQRGDTEYVIGWIPLGGYVKMSGMGNEVTDKLEGGSRGGAARKPRSSDFDAKPAWARAIVLVAGVAMNMIFAFLAYTAVAVLWGRPEVSETRLGTVHEELLPPGAESLAGLVPGARITRIGDVEVTHWGDVLDGFLAAPGETIVVETDAPRATVSVRIPEDRSSRVRLAAAFDYWMDTELGNVEPGGPAAQAGLRQGDRVLAVDDVEVRSWTEFRREIGRQPGGTVELQVLRGDDISEMAVTLATREGRTPDGETRSIGWAGVVSVSPDPAYTPLSLSQAVVAGYQETYLTTGMILGFLGDLVTGDISPRSVGSIVTIGQASGQAAEAGLAFFLRFMALFSVNLAILNLLPIPVLDGGHLLFLGIEALRGRALSVEQQLRWSHVGLVLLLGLMVWALSNDVLRLLGL